MIHIHRLSAGAHVLHEAKRADSEKYQAFTDTIDSVSKNNDNGDKVPIVCQASNDADNHPFLTGEKKVSASAITTGLYPRRCRDFSINPASLRSVPTLTTGETTICHRPDKAMDVRLELFGNTGEVADMPEAGSRSAGVHTGRGQATGLQSNLYSLRLSSGSRTVLLPLTSVR